MAKQNTPKPSEPTRPSQPSQPRPSEKGSREGLSEEKRGVGRPPVEPKR